MIDKFQDSFKEEAYELLGQLEDQLLELEKGDAQQADIDAVFRSMHTIKGSAGMFGFDDISKFTHHVETALENLRSGKIEISTELINLVLESRDQIKTMLDDGIGIDEDALGIIKRLEKYEGNSIETNLEIDDDDSPAEKETFRLFFQPNEDMFFYGSKPLKLLAELKDLGETTIIAKTDAIPDLEKLDAEKIYTSWEIIITTERGENAIKDVFIFAENECKLEIEKIDSISSVFDNPKSVRLGEILIRKGIVDQDTLQEILKTQKKLGEALIEKGIIKQKDLDAALKEQKHISTSREKVLNEGKQSTLRVKSDKLDQLVDLVGELVTVEARITQISQEVNIGSLSLICEQLERLTKELRESTMSVRMLPIGSLFGKFNRLLRDLSNELEKDIVLETVGADTELDKTVIDRLNDPLVHLLRNSIDHGIESPENRKKAGKPIQGKIVLKAEHSGSNVVISIVDDGRGLDLKKIREKAESRGIIDTNAVLSDDETAALIFQPGFSTAERITNVSGRGVGMDVVKRQIEGLRGSVSIHTETGKGLQIKLTLPLTLAIIEGLLVEIGTEMYVVPLSLVEECVELGNQDDDRRIANIRGEYLPYLRMRELFSFKEKKMKDEQIIVVDSPEGRFGMVVDKVIGGHQTVIKSLGPLFQGVECISGATILGDGGIALIMDVMKIMKTAGSELKEAAKETVS
jgi:two-component system chemotaxis sensor kinase CheA